MSLRPQTAGALLAALLLAACGPRLTSTLGDASAPAEPFGEPTATLMPATGDSDWLALRAQLDGLVAANQTPVPAQLLPGIDGVLRLRAGSDESFEPGTAQLKPAALAFYAQVASVLRGYGPAVLHVVVHGDVATDEEPSLDLSARRAASLQNVLIGAGAPAARLRAEGRADREPATDGANAAEANRRVDLVFRPVIAGREPEAWMPPAPVPCACRQPAS